MIAVMMGISAFGKVTPNERQARDEEYKNLDELCYAFGIERKSLEAKLATAGFEFNEKENKFW